MNLIDEVSKELSDKIFEVWYGDSKHEGIKIIDKWHNNAIETEGNIEAYGVNYHIRDGDRFGSEILDIGEDPYEREQWETRFVLDESRIQEKDLPLMRMKYKAMEPQIKEMCRKYAYDVRVSPTNAIEKHYRDYREKNYLKVELVKV